MKTTIEDWHVAEDYETNLLLSPAPGTNDGLLTNWRAVFTDNTTGLGLLLLAVSAGLFVAHDWLKSDTVRDQDSLGWFGIHYVMTLVYGIMTIVNGSFRYLIRNDREQQAAVWFSLVLWYISAYALNRQMAVFELSVPWLCWIIAGGGALMVLHVWADLLPRWGLQLLYAGMAGACLLFVYQAVYVASLYPLSVPGMLLLGISFHTFVPALMAFVVGRQLWLGMRYRTYLRPAVLTGLGVPLVLLVLFLFTWQRTVGGLNEVRMASALRQTSDLPDWVQMAQKLPPGPVADRILKVDLVYGTDPWSRSFGELTALDDIRLHDPLVVIANNLFPVPTFAGDEQTKLLRAVSSQHYGTESKFWSGRNLTTSQVTTQVRVWPQYRLSYTEKTLWVQSAAQWGNREALCTFHLPEGSTVSAMSLWVNGVEEPARLTTQAKADSAYKQIVGVESRAEARDPSVVTWQEGNRVTVRVFPVTPGQARQLKIGITSPLRLDGKMLTYQNPWFEGPDASGANETVKLTFATDPANLTLRGLSGDVKNRQFVQTGHYQPDWSVQLSAPALSSEPFRLDGRAYQMTSYVPKTAFFQLANVYLDVNAAWTADEFDEVYQAAVNQGIKHVWVFNDGLAEVTPDNRKDLFDALSEQRFSLFPIDRIAAPETALLVTKGTPEGPTLTDLTGSRLSDRLTKKTQTLTAPLRTYNLGGELPPYLKALAELHVLRSTAGNPAQLKTTLAKHQFEAGTETSDEVVLANSGVVIRQKNDVADTLSANGEGDSTPQTASLVPDHLLRLFTYNQLMQQVGRRYFDQSFRNNETLVAVAQTGHVVSPVSSLVVLETEKDYKRFDIKKDKSGLDNATLKQDGAVPEPHEWAMLLAIALLVGWFYRREVRIA